jgi:hypothetical protein
MNPPSGDSRWETFQRRGPLGFMLHSIGCPQPSASVLINSWNKESYDIACVHGFIDGNSGVVYQTLPWNFRGWHGGGSSNNTHVGVEMCEPACIRYTGGSNFTCSDYAQARAVATRTYNAAVELFAHLCRQFNLDPLKDGVIISHKEGHARGIATNHGDPEHLWRGLGMSYTMDGFRKDVNKKLHEEDINMSRTELIQLIQDTTGAVAFEHAKDVPSWWRDEIQKLLDADAINGGTPREKDDTDVNLTYAEAKMSAIFVRYADFLTAPLKKEIADLKAELAALKK